MLLRVTPEERDLIGHGLERIAFADNVDRVTAFAAKQLRSELHSIRECSGVVVRIDDDVDFTSIEVLTSARVPVAIVRADDPTERAVVNATDDSLYVARVMKHVQTDRVLDSLADALQEASERLREEIGSTKPDTDTALIQIATLVVRLDDAKQALEQISDRYIQAKSASQNCGRVATEEEAGVGDLRWSSKDQD